MWQFSKGVENGKLLLDVVVQGEVPDIAESEEVKVTPYWEQYLQTGPGTVFMCIACKRQFYQTKCFLGFHERMMCDG